MGDSSRIPAATRTVALLRELARSPRPVTATTVARALDLPRSTVYHLLAVLEREGLVVHLPEERRWGLGVGAFEIGSAYLRHDGLSRLAGHLLRDLATTTGATTHLGVLDGRDTLYLLKEQPARGAALVTEVGVRLPAHLTASGRSLLAAASRAQVTALYPDAAAFGDRTGRGPRTRAALRRVLDEEAARGWSHEDGEVTAGVWSVAAVARDHTGRAVASIGASHRASDARPGDATHLAEDVVATADRLTGRLGGPTT
ncbi:IclR family transcriptional regulator [Nitriliruptor alkaliphilus]|uniref:IclR family transcriptional regulator n=1 Tax=Nitriliruptor alkaliphilus TaxID=427918 RepID=UPI00069656D6|nr:IclR family transcriptional regulator [Nitriliruptor alkaliphilus]